MARIWAVAAFILGWLVPSGQVYLFNIAHNNQQPEGQRVSEHHVAEFIRTWGTNFMQHGNVDDRHGGGMPRKVPDELGREALGLVRFGYDEVLPLPYRNKKGEKLKYKNATVHRWYTSLVICTAAHTPFEGNS